MTELEAVNTMLVTIGEQPVSSLDNLAGLQDASIARQILSNISRAVQSKGWVFNLDLQVTYTPDSNGQIILGSNVIRIDSTSKVRSTSKDIVERGGRLYDRERNTSVFTDAVKVDRVVVLNFDDLPEAARRYIATRSARVFHDRVVGSGELHRFFQEDEGQAWSELLEYESDVGDYTIFDDYDVYRILERDTGKARQTTTPTT
jgi:hypothetical protein|tara:strand:- start:243 stop:851 length:609 start_codon:yes stop_codon:yes gene_type:complete